MGSLCLWTSLRLAEIDGDAEEMRESVYGNPLPGLVLDYVKERRAGFALFFNEDIQQGKKRRFAGRSHEIHIDFAGSRLVANFEPLQPSQIATSVTKIKRRLWDLKVERDRTPVMAGVRLHEMFVHAPGKDDPRFTRKQHEKVHEAIHALEEQADQEELRLRPLSSVYEMGDRILEAEAA